MNREDVKKAMGYCENRECSSCVRYNNDIREEDNCRLDLIHHALVLLREDDEDYRELEVLYQEKCDQVLKANEIFAEKDAEIADVKETYKIQREATNRLLKRVADQDAEIDRLTHICRCYALRYGTVRDQGKTIAEIRGEVATEIAEKLKKRFPVISPSVIDGIAQEAASCTKN